MTARQILLQLAELDQQTARWSEQWQRDGLLAYRQRLKEQSGKLDAARSRLDELNDEVSRRQAALEKLDAEIGRFQRDLEHSQGYETSLFKKQLEPLLQQKAGQEDVLLQIMLEQEELVPQLEPLQREMAETEQELQEAQAEEHQRIDGLCRRLEQAQQQREALAAPLGELYATYRDKGLKELKSGRCPACRLEVPDHLQRRLRQDEGVPCPTCGVVLIRSG